MQGKLKLVRGSLFALAKHAKAATAMVAAAGEVGGTFPASPGGTGAAAGDEDPSDDDATGG
jgi:hypothetical protein